LRLTSCCNGNNFCCRGPRCVFYLIVVYRQPSY
jgi:hypothetical protein